MQSLPSKVYKNLLLSCGLQISLIHITHTFNPLLILYYDDKYKFVNKSALAYIKIATEPL